MQVSAIKGVNQSFTAKKNEGKKPDLNESCEKLNSKLEHIKTNVHPITCITTAIALFGGILAAKKGFAVARRATGALTESAGDVFAKVTKKDNSKNFITNIGENLQSIGKKITSGQFGKEGNNIVGNAIDNVKGLVGKICGEDYKSTATGFNNAINKLNLKNGGDVVDATLAAGVALGISDPLSDVIEGSLDKMDEAKAIREFEADIAEVIPNNQEAFPEDYEVFSKDDEV